MPVKLTCVTCGDSFEVPPSRAVSARYCSYVCHPYRPPNEKTTIECQHCGDTFERPRFDSEYCRPECYQADRFGPPEALLTAVEEATTVHGVAEKLRMPYPDARRLLKRHNLLGEVLRHNDIIKQMQNEPADPREAD